ncbi:Enamine deaminase RidA, house cleaning of reactive enamine intermediates, YjgF/YER057c/UK114 family [Rhizobium sp. NFR07]|uniref:RidA family protein n=1 Tax=Rhizobium sp. NFR07 TaxID=1566262 RepID=UPI0008E8AC1C|nr:RidA family protein [Rhizobium sp. NFR07]SFB32237.1 Enamine deaminase RidA, house cleaning of reactive enamine intermediates, YjgF/YER057c/UK114 family [Rhizobium sp. NFR07]
MTSRPIITPVNAENAPQSLHRRYSQAVSLSGHQRLLFISGQIPADRDGHVPTDFEAQARLCWANLFAQLEAAGMGIGNLIKVTVFLKRYEDRDINAKIRFEVMGDHRPALSTIITDVYDPDWLLEIEAIAAA